MKYVTFLSFFKLASKCISSKVQIYYVGDLLLLQLRILHSNKYSVIGMMNIHHSQKSRLCHRLVYRINDESSLFEGLWIPFLLYLLTTFLLWRDTSHLRICNYKYNPSYAHCSGACQWLSTLFLIRSSIWLFSSNFST